MNTSTSTKNASPAVSNELIDRMGGNAEVRRLCGVTSAAVSQWRRNGIPTARFQYLLEVQKTRALSAQFERARSLLNLADSPRSE